MSPVEQGFHAEMLAIYEQAKALGYNAAYFRRMVQDMGGPDAARKLLEPGKIHDGFLKLLELDALEISVEALALKPEWQGLFAPSQRREAARRLGRQGVLRA